MEALGGRLAGILVVVVFADNCSGLPRGRAGRGANGGPTLVGKTDRAAVR